MTKNWTLCLCLFALVMGRNCVKDMTASGLDRQGLRYHEATRTEKSTSQRKSMLAAREEEYVTLEEFDDTVAALMAKDDKMTQDMMTLEEKVAVLEESLSATTSRVGSLENKYETATVRQCLYGDVADVCPDCYHDIGTKRSGKKPVTFSPTFHTTPNIMYAIRDEDDAGNYQLNRLVWASEVTNSSMNINLEVFGNAIAYHVGVRWMACA